MKYIKKFNNSSEYEEYALGDMILPNVSYCSDNHKVYYNPLPIHNGHEYVDLGLPSGTLWAKCNVGANSETDYGLYFAWGHIQGYTASLVGTGEGQKIFYWDDYRHGSVNLSTKYNSNDGKTELDLEDDAAHVNLGGDWHMPTKEQCEELCNTTYVTSAWVTNYNGSGIKGRLFTSVKNGNTMFIPASGLCEDSRVNGINIQSYIWTSTLSSEDVKKASVFISNNAAKLNISNYIRCSGLSVRGVLGKPKK